MTIEEKYMEILHAASGCTQAAADMMRSVNKPLNATNIAQAAWDIAKKLEEMMETAIQREKTGGPAMSGGLLSAKGPEPIFKNTAAAHAAPGVAPEDDLGLVDLAPEVRRGVPQPVATPAR